MRMIFLFFFTLNTYALDVSRLQNEMNFLTNREIESSYEDKVEIEASSSFRGRRKIMAEDKKTQKNLELVEDVEGKYFKDEISSFLAAPENATPDDLNPDFQERDSGGIDAMDEI